jgi:3-hydroxyacyl-[acyl-carrier-protein] dehydratase
MSASSAILSLIPHRPPFLFVDEIVSESADGLVARRTFRAEEDFYQGHYPGAPITPGVLLCEAVFQTGALYMARSMAGQGVRPVSRCWPKSATCAFAIPCFPAKPSPSR